MQQLMSAVLQVEKKKHIRVFVVAEVVGEREQVRATSARRAEAAQRTGPTRLWC